MFVRGGRGVRWQTNESPKSWKHVHVQSCIITAADLQSRVNDRITLEKTRGLRKIKIKNQRLPSAKEKQSLWKSKEKKTEKKTCCTATSACTACYATTRKTRGKKRSSTWKEIREKQQLQNEKARSKKQREGVISQVTLDNKVNK